MASTLVNSIEGSFGQRPLPVARNTDLKLKKTPHPLKEVKSNFEC